MTELEKQFEEIRREYPRSMNKDQFYKLAHISKATALYLLKSGLVPCTDTGKKTRRYSIRTEDVIAYLQDRIIHPKRYLPVEGWYSGKAKQKDLLRDIFLNLSKIQTTKLKRFFMEETAGFEDVIKVTQVAEFLGYSRSTVIYWCEKKKLKAFLISGRFVIPKISFIEFLLSEETMCIRRKSARHKALLIGFMAEYKDRKNVAVRQK